MKKRILNIGYGKHQLRQMADKGVMSSRLLYGVAELKDSYDFCDVDLSSGGILATLANNLRVLRRADALFFSYLYESPLVLLALLRLVGLCRGRRIVAISHNTLQADGSLPARLMHRLVLSTVDVFLFHSERNLTESIGRGLVDSGRARFFFWGDDLPFVDRTYESSQGNYIISTGREQRDYATLIAGAAKTRVPLHIYTNCTNYDSDYSFLGGEQGRHDNVHIEFVDRSNDTTLRLARLTAASLAVAIPLLRSHVNYCVGLTSIVEAMAMGKPIISSPNPYSPVDIEAEGIGLVAADADGWQRAISFLADHPAEARRMGQRARQLAEQRFNVSATAQQLDTIFKSFWQRQ